MSDEIDKIYFYRILDLVVNLGTECLLLVFYKLKPRNEVEHFFKNLQSKFMELKSRGVLKELQYLLVIDSNPDPDKFDITLLICLLTNIFPNEIKAPLTGWASDPNAMDTSLSADLIRMRNLRNEIAHRGNAKMAKDEFNNLFPYVEEVLIRIANSVSKDVEKSIQKKLIEIKTKEEYEDRVIDAWMGAFEEWKPLLDNILINIDETRQDLKGILYAVNSLAEAVQFKEESLSPEQILKMLQCDCICYYRQVLSKLQLSPLIEENAFAANFFDVYVKPNITIVDNQELKGQCELRPMSVHDIFSSKPCQNIYILSPAGCGKTSFVKYLALIWCQAHQPIASNSQWFLEVDINEMRTFMCLFIVFLRESHESECDVDIMIQNHLLPNLSHSTIYKELGLKFLQNLLSSEKCIIILDGLDEWSHPASNMCMFKNKHIPHSRARPLCTTLTTSRPWKLDVVRLQPGEIDQKLKLNGLNGDLLKRLINNVVIKMNNVQRDNRQADEFMLVLLNKKLTDLSKIPVVVMQLLILWFDNESLGESQCEIYSNMIEFLFKRYCKKSEIVSEMEDIEVDDCSRDRQIPVCLQNNMYCKVHMELLLKLATLAYNTLLTDNEESSLVFDRRIANNYLCDKEIEMSLAVGILTQEQVLRKMAKRQSHISFIHKTFQEYLAALYVALSPGMVRDVEEKFKRVSCSIKQILEMSQIFMFLSGLCPEVIVNLNEHLRQTVSEDSVVKRYRASCELDPWVSSEGQTLMQVQDTMVEWLGECSLNGHKHFTHLPVSDFFIWSPSKWSDELKSLPVHNPVRSLSVGGDNYSPEEIEDILNSVTVFNFIQKLWLTVVSNTFVDQLVSQHKHSLRVRPETWRHLKCVTLERVNMSGDILCSLVDYILQLTESVQVRLEFCCITHERKHWKAYILSHPRLTVDFIIYFDWFNIIFLQFHTNKV